MNDYRIECITSGAGFQVDNCLLSRAIAACKQKQRQTDTAWAVWIKIDGIEWRKIAECNWAGVWVHLDLSLQVTRDEDPSTWTPLAGSVMVY